LAKVYLQTRERDKLQATNDADGGARHGVQRRTQLALVPRNLIFSSPLMLPRILSA
jgi:hypothetical protein